MVLHRHTITFAIAIAVSGQMDYTGARKRVVLWMP